MKEHLPEVLAAVWDAVIDYAERHHEAPIKGKVMRIESGNWTVYVNGMEVPVDCEGLKLDRYHLAAFHRGMPWIVCTPQEGSVVGLEHAAMTTSFVKAIRKA